MAIQNGRHNKYEITYISISISIMILILVSTHIFMSRELNYIMFKKN